MTFTNKAILALFSLCMVAAHSAQAERAPRSVAEESNNNQANNSASTQTRAAACSPAVGRRDMEFNNVRALIETGGSLWQDRSLGNARYIIPKPQTENDPAISSLFAGSIWIGGVSPDQQLKLAAVTFRADGNDYWPGPLSSGGAEVADATCVEFDKFFQTSKIEANQHFQYYECLSDPDCDISTFNEGNGYSIPAVFNDWPGNGQSLQGQDEFLAPYKDYNENGFYDPEGGDYPLFDILGEIDCKTAGREDAVPLFGDNNFFWIFNDKGNIHSESGGLPIGMEIRAQAFAFNTSNEINNMTFYNYVVINQGTQTLQETYFGQWVDADLGNSNDDFVGCDVQRGLGYCYNGDENDEAGQGSLGYGINPPAVGVDFFEGPYQDSDQIDNPLVLDYDLATQQLGIPYSGIGIGYGDTIVDNERFGMRKFLYYNRGDQAVIQGVDDEPTVALHYYNFMRGFWKNGQRMSYGGNGLITTNPATDYMFPGDSDPIGWATEGALQADWSEAGEGNTPADRRFIQSAGPFTLEPGDFNNITVGVVWARATTGDPFDSVELLRRADDKAQALFDNCFVLIDGPDAPELAIQEMENELILTLENNNAISNNFQETYSKFDPSIPTETSAGVALERDDRSYKFQGYKIYQLIDGTVSAADLNDPNRARLIFQNDVKDEVTDIVNWNFDADLGTGQNVPTEMISNAANDGISHSFRVTTDAFAGNAQLVNHKSYYFIAIAYGYNNYEGFIPDLSNPIGQPEAYKESRKSAAGGEIKPIIGVPHTPVTEAGGTITNAVFGDGVEITLLEGSGNGLNNLDITAATEQAILASSSHSVDEVTYQQGRGPIDVKVVDPLNIQEGDFILKINPNNIPLDEWQDDDVQDELGWVLLNADNFEDTIHKSFKSLNFPHEDILSDYGISISINQYENFRLGALNATSNFNNSANPKRYTELIETTITYENINSPWLAGIPDTDGFRIYDWIRAGAVDSGDDAIDLDAAFDDYQTALGASDPEGNFEQGLGWVSPFKLAAYTEDIPPYNVTIGPGVYRLSAWTTSTSQDGVDIPGSKAQKFLVDLNNVDVVFTSDKDLWTRCPVLEMQANPSLAQNTDGGNGPAKCRMREHPSVDKNGRFAGQEGYVSSEGDFGGDQPRGMGWFPGYAIDVSTGQRLNMAFGEDSFLTSENGADMIWNPTANLNGDLFNPVAAGQHWIYVFQNAKEAFIYDGELDDVETLLGHYDGGVEIYEKIQETGEDEQDTWSACTWVLSGRTFDNDALLSIEDGLIPQTTRVRMRVGDEHKLRNPNSPLLTSTSGSINKWNPTYRFSLNGLKTQTNETTVLEDALDIINVVPNPYYGFSNYETNKLDNRVKFTNLPENCTISIYNLTGTLVRQIRKGDPLTSIDWDLKNGNNVPIASGTYIVHIDVPGVGEKIIKWFGILRPTDFESF